MVMFVSLEFVESLGSWSNQPSDPSYESNWGHKISIFLFLPHIFPIFSSLSLLLTSILLQ